jgi:hypothetical protein
MDSLIFHENTLHRITRHLYDTLDMEVISATVLVAMYMLTLMYSTADASHP